MVVVVVAISRFDKRSCVSILTCSRSLSEKSKCSMEESREAAASMMDGSDKALLERSTCNKVELVERAFAMDSPHDECVTPSTWPFVAARPFPEIRRVFNPSFVITPTEKKDSSLPPDPKEFLSNSISSRVKFRARPRPSAAPPSLPMEHEDRLSTVSDSLRTSIFPRAMAPTFPMSLPLSTSVRSSRFVTKAFAKSRAPSSLISFFSNVNSFNGHDLVIMALDRMVQPEQRRSLYDRSSMTMRRQLSPTSASDSERTSALSPQPPILFILRPSRTSVEFDFNARKSASPPFGPIMFPDSSSVSRELLTASASARSVAPSGPRAHLSITRVLRVLRFCLSASAMVFAAVGSPPPALMSFRPMSIISTPQRDDDERNAPTARPPTLPMAFLRRHMRIIGEDGLLLLLLLARKESRRDVPSGPRRHRDTSRLSTAAIRSLLAMAPLLQFCCLKIMLKIYSSLPSLPS
mmetsp:Transcript_23903/g.51707  ORF Transcript_23903/g.51707 Transcript_23903/m.51707 type:complete len:465 (-) Transcript_23903:544-1938(-)